MKWSTAKPEIQTGDVFLFRKSKTLFGRLIRCWTRSVYSHAGVAIWIGAGLNRRTLAIIEALEPDGVRLWPMEKYVKDYAKAGGLIDWFKIVVPLNRSVMADYCLDQWGKEYASPWQFIWTFGGLVPRIRKWLGLPADTDKERMFCSELVAAALNAGGHEQDQIDFSRPAETSPGDIARFTCLRRMGSLEP